MNTGRPVLVAVGSAAGCLSPVIGTAQHVESRSLVLSALFVVAIAVISVNGT